MREGQGQILSYNVKKIIYKYIKLFEWLDCTSWFRSYLKQHWKRENLLKLLSVSFIHFILLKGSIFTGWFYVNTFQILCGRRSLAENQIFRYFFFIEFFVYLLPYRRPKFCIEWPSAAITCWSLISVSFLSTRNFLIKVHQAHQNHHLNKHLNIIN